MPPPLPPELHSPVLVSVGRERGYGLGILGFSKPPALNTFVLIRVAESIAFFRFGVGPSALLLLHIDILQGSA